MRVLIASEEMVSEQRLLSALMAFDERWYDVISEIFIRQGDHVSHTVMRLSRTLTTILSPYHPSNGMFDSLLFIGQDHSDSLISFAVSLGKPYVQV